MTITLSQPSLTGEQLYDFIKRDLCYIALSAAAGFMAPQVYASSKAKDYAREHKLVFDTEMVNCFVEKLIEDARMRFGADTKISTILAYYAKPFSEISVAEKPKFLR